MRDQAKDQIRGKKKFPILKLIVLKSLEKFAREILSHRAIEC